MSRPIWLTLAMSLDGYIADTQDGYAWIAGQGDSRLDTAKRWDFDAFTAACDTVILGRRCYALGQHLPFAGKRIIVGTRSSLNNPTVETSADVVETVKALRDEEGPAVFVFGGAQIAQAVLAEGLLDRMVIGIVPVTLGQGIRLFEASSITQVWTLQDVIVEDGIVILDYVRRKA
jgi:dihydrofolate reductase